MKTWPRSFTEVLLRCRNRDGTLHVAPANRVRRFFREHRGMSYGYAVVLGFALGSSSCSFLESSGSTAAALQEDAPARAIAVSVSKPDRRDITDRITVPGTVTPYEQVTLYAKVTGYLKSIKVDIGDRVRRGDVLAEIDVPEMAASIEEKRATVVRAEAQVEQAKASISQYQAELEFRRASHKRLSAIRERDADVLPQQQVDQALAGLGVAESKLKTAQADVKVAEAAVASASAALATMNRMADYTRIVAPMNGVVTERFVDPGALVQAASSSRTQVAPLVSLARVDRVRVIVDVPEPSTPFVQRGTTASIVSAGLPARGVSARVARTGTVLNPGTRTMRVEFDIDNRDLRLRPGMTASVTLDLREQPDAITVPISAIQASGGEQAIFLVDGDTAKRRVVETGVESPEWIQVIRGLDGNERVVVVAALPLTEGAKVQISP